MTHRDSKNIILHSLCYLGIIIIIMILDIIITHTNKNNYQLITVYHNVTLQQCSKNTFSIGY